MICAVRRFVGGSKEIKADESPVNACALRGESGRSVAIPTGGLLRRSSIIAKSNGPGSLKISPGSRLGVITESTPDFEKVASSKCEVDEPDSYRAGVYIFGLTPPFALTAFAPDHTKEVVSATPNSFEGVGRSASRRPSLVCR